MPVDVRGPERRVEPDEGLAQHPHLEPIQRPRGRGGPTRLDPDGPGLQHSERHGQDHCLGGALPRVGHDPHLWPLDANGPDRHTQGDL